MQYLDVNGEIISNAHAGPPARQTALHLLLAAAILLWSGLTETGKCSSGNS